MKRFRRIKLMGEVNYQLINIINYEGNKSNKIKELYKYKQKENIEDY